MYALIASLCLAAGPPYVPLPSPILCERNADRLMRQLEHMRRCCDWEKCPLHDALEEGMLRDLRVWRRLASLQGEDLDAGARERYWREIVEAIGEDRLRYGAWPPVPAWEPPPAVDAR